MTQIAQVDLRETFLVAIRYRGREYAVRVRASDAKEARSLARAMDWGIARRRVVSHLSSERPVELPPAARAWTGLRRAVGRLRSINRVR